MDKKKLQESIDRFDDLINAVVTNPPENFNLLQIATDYNAIKNALAEFMKDD